MKLGLILSIMIGIMISLTICLSAVYLMPKHRNDIQGKFAGFATRILKRWSLLSRVLRRTQISPEWFVLLHIFAGTLAAILFLPNLGKEQSWIYLVTPLYGFLAPLYSLILIRSRSFSNGALRDVEEIQRITHFLERTGSSAKNINYYLAKVVKGPLSSYVRRIAASSVLSVDIQTIYKEIKEDFSDMREVVNFANISIQKQLTGKSDALYQQQLDQIKQVKLSRYKLKRTQNRIKLVAMTFLVLVSFLSLTLYPMYQAFMRDFISGMSN